MSIGWAARLMWLRRGSGRLTRWRVLDVISVVSVLLSCVRAFAYVSLVEGDGREQDTPV
jgi:hypothetical protein